MVRPSEKINAKTTSIYLDEPVRNLLDKLVMEQHTNNSALITRLLYKEAENSGSAIISNEEYTFRKNKLALELKELRLKINKKRVEINEFNNFSSVLEAQKPLVELKNKRLMESYQETIGVLIRLIERNDDEGTILEVAMKRANIYLDNNWTGLELINEAKRLSNRKPLSNSLLDNSSLIDNDGVPGGLVLTADEQKVFDEKRKKRLESDEL